MAFFVVVVDDDRARRERFLAAARRRVPTFVPLDVAEAGTGSFAALWARTPAAPADATSQGDAFALVLGDAFAGPAAHRQRAADLLAAPWASAPPWDGVHLALQRGADGTVALETDLLGLLPVFHAEEGAVFLAASTPDVLRLHPVVRPRLDPFGLAALLLTNGTVGDATLLAGVRRLPAGRALLRRPDGRVEEVVRGGLPVVDPDPARTLDDAVEALDATLAAAVRRHVPPGTPCGLLLSGGLDSRLLAGYLAENGNAVQAVSLGHAHEMDARFGALVARRLGFAHRTAEFAPTQHPDLVRRAVLLEGLSAGAASVDKWDLARLGWAGLPGTVLGAAMDVVVGPHFDRWGIVPGEAVVSLAGAHRFLESWGLGRDVARRLLRRDACGDVVDEVLAGVERAWKAGPGGPDAHAWRFSLLHRQRFHTGSMAYALAFGAWPCLPAIDAAVLRTSFGLPRAVVGARRAHVELLRRRFPGLAALPVDRNDWNDTPLLPGRVARARAWLRRHSRWVRRGERAWHRRRGDPRRYHRVYDVNGPAWHATRVRAEAHREAAHAFLDPAVLREVLPPPDVPIRVADPVAGTTAAKNLLAFLFWTDAYLTGGGGAA